MQGFFLPREYKGADPSRSLFLACRDKETTVNSSFVIVGAADALGAATAFALA